MNAAGRELLFVSMMVGFLLIICLIAVFIFIRQWRREHKSDDRKNDGEG